MRKQLVLSVCAAIAILSATTARAQGTKDVNVINGADHPVPVSVENTPGVTVTNTPTVELAPNTQVAIANGPSAPVPVVALDAAGAFQVDLSMNVNGSGFQTIAVPAGKRLVIEYVSLAGAAASASGGIQPVIVLESGLSVGGSAHYYLQPVASANASTQFYGSDPVKVYADTLDVAMGFSGFTPTFMVFNVAISGHLVSVP